MNRSKTRNPQWQRRLIHPPRAVIDIGSNTVRLVIYAGTGRAPETVWNEKVSARLGRDLSDTGRIPDEAAEEALAALARYQLLVSDRGIENIQTVATGAARDAENGKEKGYPLTYATEISEIFGKAAANEEVTVEVAEEQEVTA